MSNRIPGRHTIPKQRPLNLLNMTSLSNMPNIGNNVSPAYRRFKAIIPKFIYSVPGLNIVLVNIVYVSPSGKSHKYYINYHGDSYIST